MKPEMKLVFVRAFLFAMIAAPIAGAQSAAPRIEGAVMDSVHRRTLPGATVIATPVGGTRDTVFHSAITGATGRFLLDGMQAGRYVLTVEHPWIDSTGIGALPVEVAVAAAGVTTASLAIPSAATLRRSLCPISVADSTLGVALGVVRLASGIPVHEATVVFTWSDFEVDRGSVTVKSRQLTASVRTDSVGVYRACGLPAMRSLFVQAQAGVNQQSGVLEEQIGEVGVLVRDFRLGGLVSTVTVTPAPGVTDNDTVAKLQGGYLVAGRVVGVNGSRVSSAQVRLFGTAVSTTANEQGDFRLAGVPSGTQGLEVTALGYYPRRLRVDVGSRTSAVTVKLERAAVVLDSMRVTAKRAYAGARDGEYEARLHRGVGRFVTEDEISRRNPFLVSDLLRMMNGYAAVVGANGQVTMAQNRGVYTLQGALSAAGGGFPGGAGGGGSPGGKSCPRVYIDGVAQPDGDVNKLSPSVIRGIEVYRTGEAPAKYDTFCGAILIWTK